MGLMVQVVGVQVVPLPVVPGHTQPIPHLRSQWDQVVRVRDPATAIQVAPARGLVLLLPAVVVVAMVIFQHTQQVAPVGPVVVVDTLAMQAVLPLQVRATMVVRAAAPTAVEVAVQAA